jgi:hypothetical protein
MAKAVRATHMNDQDNWMFEDASPDEVVFTVDRCCQLLGVGLCGTEGGYTVELEVLEVRAGALRAEEPGPGADAVPWRTVPVQALRAVRSPSSPACQQCWWP